MIDMKTRAHDQTAEQSQVGLNFPRAVLTLSCPNRRGIVAAVSGLLAEQGCDILESQQFDDARAKQFFMRVVFESQERRTIEDLRFAFAPMAARYEMKWALHDASQRVRVLVMVSRFGHCLNDLLYGASTGSLPIEVPAVISNHEDMHRLAEAAGVPFVHIPVTPATKASAEARLRELINELNCEIIVLARYMQVLSDGFTRDFAGRIINIHHSFLPSFKGAKPYHQAHDRGVKLIGATAHYVTADLDEGPIIEQDVTRVRHDMPPEVLVAAGRDVEARVLARAVRWHAEHRILPHGNSTVVFN
jgi:formyltetrahydrofolate deformylase